MDDFAGLSFNEEQKAKIQQIRQDIKSRMDAVTKDDKLSQDQKDAMLFGFHRMERSQVFEVLTPEQQAEVRKKILLRSAKLANLAVALFTIAYLQRR